MNTLNYEMTRVMRIVAVMTALALIPTTIGGLLGENLIDAPWSMTIYEIVFIVMLFMSLAVYFFFRKGWLR
jgi:Mg2+ and Co2+ transporter CorA